jgi:hypothetical protein
MARESFEAGSPQTVLFAEVRRRLLSTPFEPFRIVTTSGRAYNVPTADHASVLPPLRMIYLYDDRDGGVEIHALHIASIERRRKLKRAG